MLIRARGTVKSIDAVREGACEITVDVAGKSRRAIAYTHLVGEVRVGDEVLLNITAVEKGLGTGGIDVVVANLSPPYEDGVGEGEPGHIVKARYTPVQHTVLSVEEEDSPCRKAIDDFESLGGMPVVIGQLHSQLAPAAAAIKRVSRASTPPHSPPCQGGGEVDMSFLPLPEGGKDKTSFPLLPRGSEGGCRVAYIMTDSAALPLAFSRLAAELREKGLVDCTITAGQAFGGELEAVNVYTALIAAKQAAMADVAIVCPGPGHVGTGTRFGFSAIEQGEIVNAVNLLGGNPIAVARISYADPRPRHHGLSHHTLTALGLVALTKCTLVLPMIDQMKLNIIQEQIAHSPVSYRHKVRVLDGTPGIVELQEKGIAMSSMGRSFDEDPEFFLAAAAAGVLAGQVLNSEC